jgi:phenylacetate-CoA ligase
MDGIINFLWNSYRSSSLSPITLHTYQLELFNKRVLCASNSSRFYQNEFKAAGLNDYKVTTLGDLSRLPIIKKPRLIEQNPEDILTTPSMTNLRSERSSGTSGNPFTVYYSQQEYFKRSITFLRALFTIGYQPGDKLFLLTQSHGTPTEKPWLRWYYASITESRQIVASYYQKVKPDVLYGCTTAIKLLAEYLQNNRQISWRPKAIVTTAETLDRNTRNIIEDGFRAEVFDFYGMSEVGLIAWECKTHSGYHIAEDVVFPELMPAVAEDENQRLIITSLHQQTMPFIRFDTGDYCIPAKEMCACGSTSKLIKSFSGRIIDSLLRVNGQLVSPYKVTCALECVPGLRRYQVIQQQVESYQVLVETTETNNEHELIKTISRQLKSVIGQNIEIQICFVRQIELKPGQKFRPVVSLASRGEAGND